MTSYSSEDTESSLSHVVPANFFLQQKAFEKLSPFRPVPRYINIKIKAVSCLLNILEKFLGNKLFVQNELLELSFIDSRIRGTLLRLSRKGIIYSWQRGDSFPDAPQVLNYRVSLSPIALPSGETAVISGSQGSGVGATENEALIPAIAEAIERYSVAVWNPKDIVVDSYESLKKRGAVDPLDFTFFSEAQMRSDYYLGKRVDQKKKIGWVKATSFTTGKKHLIPAQLVYLFYGRYEPESLFFSASTNGVAAHSSYTKAAYLAICEAIERDSLMIFWLNKLTPSRIDLSSIKIPKIRNYIDELEKYGFRVSVMDVTTDLQVPAFCAVLSDPAGCVGVSMSAVAGYDVEVSLEKLMLELTKFVHTNRKPSKPARIGDVADIRGFNERRLLWCRPEMLTDINFFISGKEVDFASVAKKSIKASPQSLLKLLKETALARNCNIYLRDVSSAVSKAEGLCIVRAVSPDLVPVYFNERERPYGVSRLYTSPVEMGYLKASKSEDELNPVPHPFI